MGVLKTFMVCDVPTFRYSASLRENQSILISDWL